MQKYEGVVTHIQHQKNNQSPLFPKDWDLTEFKKLTALLPFSDEAIEYLSALSSIINKDIRVKQYPDVATFAFFCRRASILQLKEQYHNDDKLRLGRGVVFHITPSNVPINFAFSLISGILSGNSNIVRVPSKRFEQIDIVSDAIISLSQIDKYNTISDRIVLVQYDRDSTLTATYSAICDVRIIWGGDETIEKIRLNKIPPRSFDITFSDRYSLCLINANAYVDEQHQERIATGFYNDTYLFDQNACTSPHLIIWLGTRENVEKAQELFWDALHHIVHNNYPVQPIIAVDKITSFYHQALQLEDIHKEHTQDNSLWRVKLDTLPVEIDTFRCTSGYFSEYHASDISELSKIVSRKYQTLSYYGISKREFEKFMQVEKPFGIDRIVPIGKTTDFSLMWDGFNLIEALSRNVEVL
jgi:hypothetical protein